MFCLKPIVAQESVLANFVEFDSSFCLIEFIINLIINKALKESDRKQEDSPWVINMMSTVFVWPAIDNWFI